MLNSTSRIQALCNKYQVYPVVSSELINALSLDDNFNFTPLGQNELKSKKENLEQFAVERNETN